VYFDYGSKASLYCILGDRFGLSKHLKKHCVNGSITKTVPGFILTIFWSYDLSVLRPQVQVQVIPIWIQYMWAIGYVWDQCGNRKEHHALASGQLRQVAQWLQAMSDRFVCARGRCRIAFGFRCRRHRSTRRCFAHPAEKTENRLEMSNEKVDLKRVLAMFPCWCEFWNLVQSIFCFLYPWKKITKLRITWVFWTQNIGSNQILNDLYLCTTRL